MDSDKQRRLAAAGFRVGTVAEFLGLTPQEEALVEARATLARLVRERREGNDQTQVELAKAAGTSQSRLARIESAHESVTLDLLFKTALAAGISLEEIGEALQHTHTPHAAASRRT